MVSLSSFLSIFTAVSAINKCCVPFVGSSSSSSGNLVIRLPKHMEDSNGFEQEGIPLTLRRQECTKSPRPARHLILPQDGPEAV